MKSEYNEKPINNSLFFLAHLPPAPACEHMTHHVSRISPISTSGYNFTVRFGVDLLRSGDNRIHRYQCIFVHIIFVYKV